jgi:hypothetical protein
VWPALSALAHRASFIKVRDGVITLRIGLHESILELSGKGALGRDGALELARVLAKSAAPSVLTALDIRREILAVGNGKWCSVTRDMLIS